MAHNLYFDETTNRHSFFSVKEKPWHGLGKIVDHYPTSGEALCFAGLDYTVEKRPLFAHDNKGELTLPVPAHFATVRTDNETVLGVVGKDYGVVQNRDAFSFFDSIVGGDGIQYETAGALGRGERIFITAKLPGYIRVGREDLIEQYIFLTTSHDGYGSITAAFTPTRIVCNNTLHAALRNSTNVVRIRHTTGAKERLEEAHKVMGIANGLAESLQSIFNQWTKVRISDNEVRKLIQLAMAPSKEVLTQVSSGYQDALSAAFQRTCDEAFAYAMNNPTQEGETTKGTLFGAYNAVTGYFQNVRTYKDSEAKLKSLLLGGTAQNRTQKAFDLCGHFVVKGPAALCYN